MLIYVEQIRRQFQDIRVISEAIRDKFDQDITASVLLNDVKTLEIMYDSLSKNLPKNSGGVSNFGRHLFFLKKYLSEGNDTSCKGDINDICNNDIRIMEDAFFEWCKNQTGFDDELREKIADLLLQQHLDSAIRRAFIVLSNRIRRKYGLGKDIDGVNLINQVFGTNSVHVPRMTAEHRQSMRNFLCGLYGLFRNEYAHDDENPTWAEADAIISIINLALLKLDKLD